MGGIMKYRLGMGVCVMAERPGQLGLGSLCGVWGRWRSCSAPPVPFSVPSTPVALPIERSSSSWIRPHALVLMPDLSFLLKGDSGPYTRLLVVTIIFHFRRKGLGSLFFFF